MIEVLIDLSERNGLRPAEARGLRWSRLDLDAFTLRVDAQINRRNAIVKPKTKQSSRTIRFDTATAERLERWRQLQTKLQGRAGSLWANDDDLVATTARGTDATFTVRWRS